MPVISNTQGAVQTAYVSYNSYQLTADLELYWPNSGQNIPDDQVAAAYMEFYIVNSPDYSVTLPDARQVSVGQNFIISNTGVEPFILKDNAGEIILAAVLAGKSYYFILNDNSTAGGGWLSLEFGAGTSTADAAALAGLGLKVDPVTPTTLDTYLGPVLFNIDPTPIPYDANAKIYVWTLNGNGSAILPTVASIFSGWWMAFNNQGNGNLTIQPQGGATIDGETDKTLLSGQSCFVTNNGTNWFTVGLNTNIPGVNPLPLSLGGTSGTDQQEAAANILPPPATVSQMIYFQAEGEPNVWAVSEAALGTGALLSWNTTSVNWVTSQVPLATGDLFYWDNATKVWTRLPVGAEGETLKIQGGVPAWVA